MARCSFTAGRFALSQLWWVGHLVSSALFCIMLLLVLSLLRSRRPAGNTIAWIFAVVLIPYLGIPLYLLFGARKIKRRKRLGGIPEERARGLFAPGPTAVEQVLLNLGMPAPAANRQIELIDTGEKAYASLIGEIAEARVSIDIMTFIFSRDDVGELILQNLIDRAKSGVRVRLLIDAWGSSLLVRPSFRALLAAGGSVAYALPLLHSPSAGKTNLRNHRKLAVFDRESVLFGGMNIAHEYLGPVKDEKRWVDLCFRLKGSSVIAFAELFDDAWAVASRSLAPKVKVKPDYTTPASPHVVQIVDSGPDVACDPIYDGLLTACFDARARLWIATPYFVPDETLTKALILARRRGVDVRVLVPRKSNHLFADLCRGSYLTQLNEAGCGIYYFPRMTHAKLVVKDGHLAVVGSANFDLRSLLYNYELGVFLYSTSEVSELASWFEARFEEAKLTPVRKPSTIRETIEGIARIFGPMF